MAFVPSDGSSMCMLYVHVHVITTIGMNMSVIITFAQSYHFYYLHVFVMLILSSSSFSAVFPKMKQKKKSQQIMIYTQSGLILSTIPVSLKKRGLRLFGVRRIPGAFSIAKFSSYHCCETWKCLNKRSSGTSKVVDQ